MEKHDRIKDMTPDSFSKPPPTPQNNYNLSAMQDEEFRPRTPSYDPFDNPFTEFENDSDDVPPPAWVETPIQRYDSDIIDEFYGSNSDQYGYSQDDFYAETTTYPDGKTWTKTWYKWHAVGNFTENNVTNLGMIGFRWEDGKIVEENHFGDSAAFNAELIAYQATLEE